MVVRRFVANGANLGYARYGSSDGPPLLFTHGYAMRATDGPYDDLLERLAERHAVHALDLRGHGGSVDSVADWSFETLADDVAAFVRESHLREAVFVGHSFGAVIGLCAAIRHPGLFSALCLLSPGPVDPARHPVRTLDFLVEHGHERETMRAAFGPMFVRAPGRRLEATLDAVTSVPTEVHRAHRARAARFSIASELSAVAEPVLVVCGDVDAVVPPAQQMQATRRLRCFEHVVFSGEGHMLAIESPAIAARAIFAFLERDGDDPSPPRRDG